MIDLIVNLLDLISNIADTVTGLTDTDLDTPGHTVHGGPDDTNIHGTRPSDIHGNPVGNDGWGRPNNTTLHG